MIIRSFKFRKQSNSKQQKKKFLFLVLAFAFLLFFVYLPYRSIKVKGQVLKKSASELKYAFSQNDIDLVKKEFGEFSRDYMSFRKSARFVYWMSFVPYVADFKNGVEAGVNLLGAGRVSIDSIAPYADLIGFRKGKASFSEQSAEDRLQTAVLTLDKVLVNIDSISEDVKKAEDKIKKINPNRYPKKVGKIVVREKIANIKDQFEGLASLVVDAKPLLKNIPVIFGRDGEKTYLLLFQNDKERRATGGFLTSTAIFRIKNGKIKVDHSQDIYTLDNSISSHPQAPEQILTYHKGVSRFYIRDSNLSPDLVESIKLFNSLYERSSQKVDYNGIITLDSKVLVDMLSIYGDTEVNGIRFSSKEDPRCDCPQVLYTLFDIVDRPVNYIKENRKGILGDLMYALLYKALGFSPSKYYGTLTQTMFRNLEEKHILLYFTDPNLQNSVEKLNFAGRVRDFDGDYLYINNVNFAGAKSNLFVSETVKSDTKLKSGGIERDVVVEFKNPYPHSDCNLERGGLCLNATLRNWIRFYVPKGSKLVSFIGSSKKVKTYDELDKTVFEGFLTVDPKGFAKITLKYTLPSDISPNNYQLLIQKQPSADTQTVIASVNGREKTKGILKKDIIISDK